MALDRQEQPADQFGRGFQTIFERLEEARKRRARILDTPKPANEDRQAPRRRVPTKSFPTLKPQKPDAPAVSEPRERPWLVPALLSLAILTQIVIFAVR